VIQTRRASLAFLHRIIIGCLVDATLPTQWYVIHQIQYEMLMQLTWPHLWMFTGRRQRPELSSYNRLLTAGITQPLSAPLHIKSINGLVCAPRCSAARLVCAHLLSELKIKFTVWYNNCSHAVTKASSHSHFHPSPTFTMNSTANVTQYYTWKAEPQNRGTFSILSTCILTLVLCVWKAIHVNIPEYSKTADLFWRKAGWVMMALFTSELV